MASASNAGAVVLRSNSDLVYLPDHGFVGEEGALRILAQVTRQIRRLDVSHNLLGSEGTIILMQGLGSLRGQYSTPEMGTWGLTEINLGHNRITDAAVDVIMGYAKKDVFLREVMLQGNRIELRTNLESIVHALNSSRIDSLSLTDNKRLHPAAVSRFFDALSTPHLTELHLSISNLGPEVVPSIVDYLSSPRSRNMELLGLNGNNIGPNGVEALVNAAEFSNFTIANLGLFSNGTADYAALPDAGQGEGDHVRILSKEDRDREESLLADQTARLPAIFARNRLLTRRVQQAALRCLSCARILLNARSPSPLQVAQQAIASISLTSSPAPYFRLLDLPSEVLYLVVRHTSGDALALSDAQFTRLRKDAEGKEGLARAMRLMRSKGRVWSADKSDKKDAELNVREDWLKWGRWDKWESDLARKP